MEKKTMYFVRRAIILAGIPACCFFVSVSYAQQKSSEEKKDTLLEDFEKIKHDVKILRREIKNVRSSVSQLKKSIRPLKEIPSALTELNVKLEAQITTVNALSGELYRLGSALEKKTKRGAVDYKEIEHLTSDITAQKQNIRDLKDEIHILREVQSDLQAQPVSDTEQDSPISFVQKVLQWKYWGHAAFGLALIALMVAL